VAKRDWEQGGGRTAGDLGSLILRELARTYALTRRELHAWLESWELGFFKEDEELSKVTLIEVRSLVAEFRRRLAALNQPGTKDEEAWFASVTTAEAAKRTDDYIDRALSDLRELQTAIRSGFDLATSRESSQQLKLAQEQQERTEQLQSTLELGAAVLLVPTLVAGIYGANTELPGGGTWGGFAVMLAAMVLGTILALGIIRRIRGDDGRGG